MEGLKKKQKKEKHPFNFFSFFFFFFFFFLYYCSSKFRRQILPFFVKATTTGIAEAARQPPNQPN